MLVNHNSAPPPCFSYVWQGKDLQETNLHVWQPNELQAYFLYVWQRKNLGRIVAKPIQNRRIVEGDTRGFCIDVNIKELLAEGLVSA